MSNEQPRWVRVPDVSALAEWLKKEMPSGTVISNPEWWAPRIIKAMLAAHTQSQTEQQGRMVWVPEDWQVVPKEPSIEQIRAIPWPASVTPDAAVRIYKAMLAAPSLPERADCATTSESSEPKAKVQCAAEGVAPNHDVPGNRPSGVAQSASSGAGAEAMRDECIRVLHAIADKLANKEFSGDLIDAAGLRAIAEELKAIRASLLPAVQAAPSLEWAKANALERCAFHPFSEETRREMETEDRYELFSETTLRNESDSCKTCLPAYIIPESVFTQSTATNECAHGVTDGACKECYVSATNELSESEPALTLGAFEGVFFYKNNRKPTSREVWDAARHALLHTPGYAVYREGEPIGIAAAKKGGA